LTSNLQSGGSTEANSLRTIVFSRFPDVTPTLLGKCIKELFPNVKLQQVGHGKNRCKKYYGVQLVDKENIDVSEIITTTPNIAISAPVTATPLAKRILLEEISTSIQQNDDLSSLHHSPSFNKDFRISDLEQQLQTALDDLSNVSADYLQLQTKQVSLKCDNQILHSLVTELEEQVKLQDETITDLNQQKESWQLKFTTQLEERDFLVKKASLSNRK
jgi:uncharacterized coiled-coil protein SlyX